MLTWLRGKADRRTRKKIRRRPAPLVLRTEFLEDRAVPSATLVQDINTHTNGSIDFTYGDSSHSVELNGRMYFFADDGIHGRELWSTDGTDLGTQLVKDIFPGPEASDWGSSGAELARVGDRIVFAADDGVHGNELWISDGTTDGTQILKDLAPAAADADGNIPASFPMMFREAGGKVFFVATDSDHGQELWVTDGTSDGTQIVSDINPGNLSSFPNNFTTIGDKLYFTADDGVSGSELWVTDGTAGGTHMVSDIGQPHSTDDFGEIGSNPGNLTVAGGKLFFTADDGLHGSEVWVTDGTDAGTHMVADINTVSNTDPLGVERTASSNPYGLSAVGDRVDFVATDNDGNLGLWSTDGTADGTGRVAPALDLGSPYLLVADGSTLYFAAGVSHDNVNGVDIWKTDGTADGTVRIAHWDDSGGEPVQGVSSIFVHDGTVYFSAGNVLSKVDGDGVTDVEKFGTRAWNSPTPFGTLGDKLFIAADDGVHGAELWTLDANGATMVKDINATTMSSSPRNLVTVGGVTYFTADDGEHGQSLWKTDGTADGTVLVKSFPAAQWPIGVMTPAAMPVMPGPWISNLTDFNGTLFFTANDGVHGEQLWMSDGTEAGTVMLTGNDTGPKDGGAPVAPPAPDIVPWTWGGIGNLTVSGGQLYFTQSQSWNSTELWKTDGTIDGTVKLFAFSSSNTTPPPIPLAAAPAPTPTDSPTPSPSTTMYPYFGSLVGNLTDINGTLFFSADDGVHGTELWKSDGTADGTVMVKDINPNSQPPAVNPVDVNAPSTPTPLGSTPSNFAVLNGKLYFNADDGTHGAELWVSDGTDAGTMMVTDINPGSAGSMAPDYTGGATAPEMTSANGKLYFTADDGVHGQELWLSDGTAAGTHMLKNIHPDNGAPMWDGGPPVSGSAPQQLTAVGNAVFFSANDGVHGQELWVTDGTADGTKLVTDIYAGDLPMLPGQPAIPYSSYPGALTNVNGMLYFTANDADHGTELWMSDGTEAGTKIAAEPTPGPASSVNGWGAPGSVGAVLGDKLLFAASAPAVGEELFSTDAPTVTMTLDGPSVSAGGPYHTVEAGKLDLHGSVTGRPDANRLHYAWDLNGDGVTDAKGQNPTMVGAQLRALGLFGGPDAHRIHLTVTDDAGTVVGTADADLLIDDAPLTATGVSLDVTEGQNFNRNVASFKDPGGFEGLSHYSATVDWGDGTTSAGTIIRDGSNLRVAGAHSYSHHGHYSIDVSISDDGGPAVTATSTVLVHDAGIYAGRTFVRGSAGRALSDVVATFRDMNPGGDISDFGASINWGDGTTSDGTIVAGPAGYQVMGIHTYSASGDYGVTVTINSTGGVSATAQSLARISPVTLTPRGLTASTTVGSDATLTVAAFRDTDRAATAGLFTAMIDWADGSTSAGDVTADGTGGFRVGGSHKYAKAGLYSVKVTLQDVSNDSATTTGTVRVVN